MKEETKRKILLAIICLLTLAILVVAIKINENRVNNELSVSKIDSDLTEIIYDDISNYVAENPSAIIYVSDSSSDISRNFEKLFIPIVKKYNLENKIIYININNLDMEDPFYQVAPEFILYKNTDVKEAVDLSNIKTQEELINILKERSVIGD